MTHNDELVKVQIDQEQYEELIDAVQNNFDENFKLVIENRNLKDFIVWMNLDDSYAKFCQNTQLPFKESSEPFGHYTL